MLLESVVLIPVVAAMLIVVAGSYPNLRESITLLTALSLFVVVYKLYVALGSGVLLAVDLWEVAFGLSLALAVEPLGMLFALVASFLWLVTSVYSIGYMRAHHESNQTRFYACFALALAAVMGIAFSANMFTLFVFYELLTLVTYPLVTHSGSEKARHAGRRYLGYLLASSVCFQLLAIVCTWLLAGTLDFTPGGILNGRASDGLLTVLFALYVFGIGKAALMPLHGWLPAAMVAPTPVSALLHAVAVVKAGVFTVLKVSVYIFGVDLLMVSSASEWLIYVATITILMASIIAMYQDNLKARLAYSTISQLAYIVLGAMLASRMGVIGSGMHIATHAFGKITLFFCAGAIMVASHKTEISQMRGLGRRMPFTMMAFFIGSCSIIGLPLLGGMWSKWFLVLGTVETAHYIPLLVLLVSSLLNVAYLLPIPIRGFYSRADDDEPKGVVEAPWPCLVAMAVTCAGCVLLFFYPQPMYELMQSIFNDLDQQDL